MDLFWGATSPWEGSCEARNNLFAQIRQIILLKRRMTELTEVFV